MPFLIHRSASSGCSSLRMSARIYVVSLVCLLLGISSSHAGDSSLARVVTIPLTPVSPQAIWSALDGKIEYVDLLPGGRIAVLGGVPRGPDGYLRLIDMKTGQETYYYLPNSDGFGGADNGWADVAVLDDLTFIYYDGSALRRAATGSFAFPNSHVDPKSDGGAAPGAMVADHNSLLVGWGGLIQPEEGNDCGTGPVVVRLSSEGSEIWRWHDPTEKYAFPDEIVVLSDGTILALVEGNPRRWPGYWWNACPSDLKYLVALSSDGREIARVDLPPEMSLTPLALSADGAEVLAADVAFDGTLSAILHIRMDAGQIQIERDRVADEISTPNPHDVLVTSLEGGGYRLITFSGAVMTLDRQGHIVDRSFPIIGGQRCSLDSGLGLVCWYEDRVSVLPLY